MTHCHSSCSAWRAALEKSGLGLPGLMSWLILWAVDVMRAARPSRCGWSMAAQACASGLVTGPL